MTSSSRSLQSSYGAYPVPCSRFAILRLNLALLARLSRANVLVAIVADVIMILTSLPATFGDGDGDGQQWGWYTIACIAYLAIADQLESNGPAAVAWIDSKTKSFYGAIGGFILVLLHLSYISILLGNIKHGELNNEN